MSSSLPLDLRRKLEREAKKRGLAVPAQSFLQIANVPTPEGLFAFAAATLAFELHGWQALYCELLERLRTEKGLRLLVHGPPQFGKTIISSQRLPAYLLGQNPILRIGVACYNETHAVKQTSVVRDLMAMDQYRQWYPSSAVAKDASAKEFSTPSRAALHDGQVSVKALGLLSGFTGRGVDLLIIDDPYASADAARSEAVNGAVWRWWSETTKPRIMPEANVLVMFHRYHDDDLAAKLEKEGGWELYRFPAIADGDDAAGTDLTLAHGLRSIGEPLSPMRTLENLRQLEASDAQTFASQFQGKPRPDKGGMFRIGEIKETPLVGIVARCRAWDIASTSGAGDYTAGVLEGKDREGRYEILNAKLVQGGPDEVDALIVDTAKADGKSVKVRIARDPGSAGVRDAQRIARLLAGYVVEVVQVSGAKEVRARPLASQVGAGNVHMAESFGELVLTGPYRGMDTAQAMRRMLQAFPFGTAKKDGVDAAADAFSELAGLEPEDKPKTAGIPYGAILSSGPVGGAKISRPTIGKSKAGTLWGTSKK